MWTCGIDIATQQATPASTSSAMSVFGDRPSGRVAADAASALCVTGASRAAARGAAAEARAAASPPAQKMPTPM